MIKELREAFLIDKTYIDKLQAKTNQPFWVLFCTHKLWHSWFCPQIYIFKKR